MLISSSVPEVPPAAHVMGTTYAKDATASAGAVGGLITVWKSLQAANTGHTPASSPTWWLNIGTTYAVHDLVIAGWTGRDMHKVQEHIEELAALGSLGFDVGLTGFSEDELAEVMASVSPPLMVEEPVQPLPAKPVTQRGDLWLLGEHRVLRDHVRGCEG